MRDLGLESDFPVVVAADLAGVNVWRRLSGGFASSAGLISYAVERASGFTSVRWHLSLMRVALLHGAVRTEVLSLGSSARALSGDDWWWFRSGSSSALICSIEAMVVTVWNRGGDLALASLLHPWEMILEAIIA
ncbi:hypothetical protein IGI04_012869 [Brassica rapa subsp. trilocularis]|uniref:Uncharacterized protein n=1 Tax=Brassica rapa subsp. trilocularis TaxID=1813537 RepID=A0ABQ7N9J3_BRACM|nr:hypothetical protein IGI04_012869 [Brassica rapa subsp. trilocularis]